MHQEHKAGEKMFVDYCGQTVPVTERDTGKVCEAQIFVAVLGNRGLRNMRDTRNEKDRRWCERIWTMLATYAAQGRSPYIFLLDSLQAHFHGQPAPSLLLNSS